jgi:hypothetical protein
LPVFLIQTKSYSQALGTSFINHSWKTGIGFDLRGDPESEVSGIFDIYFAFDFTFQSLWCYFPQAIPDDNTIITSLLSDHNTDL